MSYPAKITRPHPQRLQINPGHAKSSWTQHRDGQRTHCRTPRNRQERRGLRSVTRLVLWRSSTLGTLQPCLAITTKPGKDMSEPLRSARRAASPKARRRPDLGCRGFLRAVVGAECAHTTKPMSVGSSSLPAYVSDDRSSDYKRSAISTFAMMQSRFRPTFSVPTQNSTRLLRSPRLESSRVVVRLRCLFSKASLPTFADRLRVHEAQRNWFG